MALLKIYDGVAWITIVAKVWDGTVWQAVLKYFDGTSWIDLFIAAVVTISGQSISSANKAGVRINTDGTIDQRKNNTYTQIDSGTDWIIPNSEAGSATYHVKLLIIESNMHANSDPMNQWIALDQNREWWHEFSGLTRNGTLSISDDGGVTTLDSGPYNLIVP